MKDHESDHINKTKVYVGCLPCATIGWGNMHADYHHAEAGRKRKEHVHGFGMCLWHHRGERDQTLSHLPNDEIESRLGPSFQRDKRRFKEVFGDEALLVELNNFALSLWFMQPWLEHCMPQEVQSCIKAQHKKLLNERVTLKALTK